MKLHHLAILAPALVLVACGTDQPSGQATANGNPEFLSQEQSFQSSPTIITVKELRHRFNEDDFTASNWLRGRLCSITGTVNSIDGSADSWTVLMEDPNVKDGPSVRFHFTTDKKTLDSYKTGQLATCVGTITDHFALGNDFAFDGISIKHKE